MRRILVADDHPVCSAALTMSIRVVDPATLVDCVTTLSDAEQKLRAQPYDLIFLDLMLPDVQGFAGLALVKAIAPNTTVAMVSSRDERSVVRQAATLGAAGFLSKSLEIDRMVSAIRVLLEGGQWYPKSIMVENDGHSEIAKRLGTLSVAQLRVLRAIANGHQNKQIAFDLDLAEPTVKSHLAAIFRKLGVSNRTQAVLAMKSFEEIVA